MSQAEALLNNIMIEHEHPVIDNDQRYVIDPASRTISNVSGKNVLIQYDHDSERFTFEIPRYVDGHDMSLCNATRVHYINIEVVEQDPNALGVVKPKTKPGVYTVEDIQVCPDDEEKVTCSWLISRNATQLSGSLSFLIQYACVDDNGYLTYEWHTDIYSDVLVRTGMNNGADTLANSADIIEQWKRELFADVEVQVQEIADRFQDGKTPVRGVDYWTEDDKEEMISSIVPKLNAVTLVSTNWNDKQQTVSVPGVTSDVAKTMVTVSPEPSDENYSAYTENGIRCISQGENTLTFLCDSPPTTDVIANVVHYRITDV